MIPCLKIRLNVFAVCPSAVSQQPIKLGQSHGLSAY